MARAGVGVLAAPSRRGAGRQSVRLPWFDSVLADIGDDQSITQAIISIVTTLIIISIIHHTLMASYLHPDRITQSLSTFSSHIGRVRRIIDAAETSSAALVLLDEVCRPRRISRRIAS